MNYIAQVLGTRRPMSIPSFLAKLILGAPTLNALTSSSRCRNQFIKGALGWKPTFPTYREGFRAEIENLKNE